MLPKLSTTGLFLLLLSAQCGHCQVTASRTIVADLASKLTYRSQLDSSINVNALSVEDGNRLIERMYVIDQQYRKELGPDINRQDEKAQKALRLMTINDQSNQAILLKLLKRFGWPCHDSRRQLGAKAYWIAWHARGDYDKMAAFYPYLVKATQRRCLPVGFKQEYGKWLTALKRTYQR